MSTIFRIEVFCKHSGGVKKHRAHEFKKRINLEIIYYILSLTEATASASRLDS